jgi:hypothetical protein
LSEIDLEAIFGWINQQMMDSHKGRKTVVADSVASDYLVVSTPTAFLWEHYAVFSSDIPSIA